MGAKILASNDHAHRLSRRERQILDVLLRLGRATASDVQRELPDSPGYSAVRALLRILEEKGHARHVTDGPRYVYLPAVSRTRAARSAAAHLVSTYFGGSVAQAVAGLLDGSAGKLGAEELDRLAGIIETARKKEKP
jgi:predicted transcriptional regulator